MRVAGTLQRLDEQRGPRRQDDLLAARVGGWCVAAALVVLVFKLGAVSSPGYGPPSWKPWTWRPGLLFRNTTTNGGDTGAHVWTPDFLRRRLLPALRTSGWSKDWYAGFPVLRFYFPGPMWVITLLGLVIPADVAFKLVSVSGIVALPFAVMSLARAAGLGRTSVHLFALATVVFLYDPHYDILGGNILSTMAGEFSFSIGLAVAVAFLAALLRMLRAHGSRWLPALLLGVCVVCHILPALFAGVAATWFVIAHLGAVERAARWAGVRDCAVVAVLGALLPSFWTFPFAPPTRRTRTTWDGNAAPTCSARCSHRRRTRPPPVRRSWVPWC